MALLSTIRASVEHLALFPNAGRRLPGTELRI